MDLAKRVQDLPLELYSLILDFILTPDSSITHIEPGYKPPVQLAVSHATRKQFAQRYYGQGSVFQTNLASAEKWLASLPIQHIGMLSEVRFDERNLSVTIEPGFLPCVQSILLRQIRLALKYRLPELASEAIYVKIVYGPQKAEKWVPNEAEMERLRLELERNGKLEIL